MTELALFLALCIFCMAMIPFLWSMNTVSQCIKERDIGCTLFFSVFLALTGTIIGYTGLFILKVLISYYNYQLWFTWS